MIIKVRIKQGFGMNTKIKRGFMQGAARVVLALFCLFVGNISAGAVESEASEKSESLSLESYWKAADLLSEEDGGGAQTFSTGSVVEGISDRYYYYLEGYHSGNPINTEEGIELVINDYKKELSNRAWWQLFLFSLFKLNTQIQAWLKPLAGVDKTVNVVVEVEHYDLLYGNEKKVATYSVPVTQLSVGQQIGANCGSYALATGCAIITSYLPGATNLFNLSVDNIKKTGWYENYFSAMKDYFHINNLDALHSYFYLKWWLAGRGAPFYNGKKIMLALLDIDSNYGLTVPFRLSPVYGFSYDKDEACLDKSWKDYYKKPYAQMFLVGDYFHAWTLVCIQNDAGKRHYYVADSNSFFLTKDKTKNNDKNSSSDLYRLINYLEQCFYRLYSTQDKE